MLTNRKKLSPSFGLAVLSLRLMIMADIINAHQLPPDATQTLPETNSTGQNSDLVAAGNHLHNNTRRFDTATVNQICSSQRARNSSLCRSCRCNPNGSNSSHCDAHTRRCSCSLGYTGSTCNKCSVGYHKSQVHNNQSPSGAETKATASIDLDPLEERSITRVLCVPCDECYHQWRQPTSMLKDAAVKIVERAHKLDQNYVNQIGVATPTHQASQKLSFVGNRTTLSDIDQIVSKLGEQILDNKQKSDRLHLLSGELKMLNDSLEPNRSSLDALITQANDLDVELVRLHGKLELQSGSIRNMSTSLAGVQQEIISIQERIPLAVPRLIERNRARSHRALIDIREIDQIYPLRSTIDELDLKRDKIEFSKRQLDIIGMNILTNHIGHRIQNSSVANESMRFSSQDLENLSYFTLKLESTARSIAALLLNHSASYQSQHEARYSEMRSIKRNIEAANTTLLLSGQLLMSLANNQLGSNSIDFLVNINRLLNDSSGSNRASLDRIDVEWSSAQVQNAELSLKLKEFTDSNATSSNMAPEIDKIINDNLTKLMNFRDALPKKDLDELSELRKKLTRLTEDDLKSKQAQLKLNELEIETTQRASQTEALIAKIRSMLDVQMSEHRNSAGNSTDYDFVPASSDSSSQTSIQLDALERTARTLVSKSGGLLDRLQTHVARQIDQEMFSVRQMDRPISETRNVTDKLTSSESKNKLLLLWQSLSKLGEVRPKNSPSDFEAINSNDKRRFANVKTEVKQLSMMLNEGLKITYELAADFADHGRDLADLREKIGGLHYQIDSINDDLEQRFIFHDYCLTA